MDEFSKIRTEQRMKAMEVHDAYCNGGKEALKQFSSADLSTLQVVAQEEVEALESRKTYGQDHQMDDKRLEFPRVMSEDCQAIEQQRDIAKAIS